MPFLVISVFFTSAFSGTFGMGGGLILMGILPIFYSIPQAMIAHGIIQLCSNGYRAYLLRSFISTRYIGIFLLGSLISAVFIWLLNPVPSKAQVYILLGIIPLLSMKVNSTSIFKKHQLAEGVVMGFISTSCNILGGASGPIIDTSLYQSSLKRREIVATKSLFSSLIHIMKIVYYAKFTTFDQFEISEISEILMVLVAVITGTKLGSYILNRIKEDQFRLIGVNLVRLMALIFVARGVFYW
ncbi:MAG: TSUP family transporter [Bacteriovoracaceae bacterium]|jgi:uncharacterized protein|nr:TSUP family transporter [Bacteriovoracaceae bacterium]